MDAEKQIMYLGKKSSNLDISSKISSTDSQPASQSSISSIKNPFYTPEAESMTVHVTTNCGNRMELYYVPRRYYASELEVLIMKDTGLKYDHFQLFHKGKVMAPMTRLQSLMNSNGIVELTMNFRKTADGHKKVRLGERDLTFKSGLTIRIVGHKAFTPEPACGLEDKLVIQYGKNKSEKNITVQWLPPDHHKPFIGGYRHILTQMQYHHAWAQTLPMKRSEVEVDSFSRETQTYQKKHRGQTTLEERSTQFPMPGYFVSNAKDQVRIPGPYETAEEYWERKIRNVIIIQKYTRRWLAKKRMKALRELRDAFLDWQKNHEAQLKERKEKQLKRDYERRLHPKTQADFDRLFSALEQWKVEEKRKIEEQNLTPAERKTALTFLLDEETELIAAIGRHQLCVSQKSNNLARLRLLQKAAAPIRWTSSITGRPIEAETQHTQRGKELLDIFISLTLNNLTPEERLDLLLTTKRTVKQYEFKVCKELIRLIDREGELIMMGIKDKNLKGLRQRINHLFFKFCELPDVNPEIVHYLRVPTGTKEKIATILKGDVYYCLACDRYLRNESFPLSARIKRFATCEACQRLNNRARKRQDLDEYERMLTELREKELRLVEKARLEKHTQVKEAELDRLERGEAAQPETICKLDGTDFTVLNSNPFPFLVDKQDIQFLVDNVWERRSVLSGWLDVMDLVLTRWRLNEPWSPWNTILVTREEAEAHERLGSFPLELAYADSMLNIVNQRLVTGRNAFTRLLNKGIRMAYEQVVFAQRMQNPEETQEWLDQKRQRLPPLAPHYTNLKDVNEFIHQATYQPPDYMLPAIRGERRLSEVKQDYAS